MPLLDLRLLNLMTFMLSVAMSFVLLMLKAHYPLAIRGTTLWGMAPVVAVSSTLFYGLEHLLPPWTIVVFGNGLLLAGCALFYFGSCQFFGLAVRWRPWAVVGLVVILWHAFFFLVHPDYRLRLSVFAGALALLQGAHVRLLLRHARGLGASFTAGVMALQVAMLVVRAVSTFWLDQPDSHRFDSSLLQGIYVASFSFAVLLISVGVLLMASEGLRDEMERLANHDSLTGVLTRRALLQAGELAFTRWQRYGHVFALVMMDLDHFKQINDRHGHAVGDRVLQRVAGAMGEGRRSVDHLGRHGGEEFLALLPGIDAAGAVIVAYHMHQAVDAAQGDGLPPCTLSMGVAGVAPGDKDLAAVLARADAALYRAKQAGRNRVEAAAPP